MILASFCSPVCQNQVANGYNIGVEVSLSLFPLRYLGEADNGEKAHLPPLLVLLVSLLVFLVLTQRKKIRLGNLVPS